MTPAPPAPGPVDRGPAVVLCGACSPAALAQVRAFAPGRASAFLDPIELDGGDPVPALVGWLGAKLADGPAIVFSTAPPDWVERARDEVGPDRVGPLVESAFARLARSMLDRGVRTFVVVGDRTAAAVTGALGAAAVAAGPQVAPGLAWEMVDVPGVDGPVGLLRISGGGPDLLDVALAVRRGETPPEMVSAEMGSAEAVAAGPDGAEPAVEPPVELGVADVAALTAAAAAVAGAARALAARGLVPGSSGNLSRRVGPMVLISPAGADLARLDPAAVAVVDLHGRRLGGPAPSGELDLHLAVYRARPDLGAVAHVHAVHTTALGVLVGPDPDDVVPPVTVDAARLGPVGLVPYRPPGSAGLAAAVGERVATHAVLVLAHHGGLVAGIDLDEVVDRATVLEETARLVLVLGDRPRRDLPAGEVEALRRGPAGSAASVEVRGRRRPVRRPSPR